MSTTTIRLDADLKARVAALAERRGQSAHAYLLEAIENAVATAEAEASLQRVADERWARIAEGGPTVAWDDARTWLQASANRDRPPRPSRRER